MPSKIGRIITEETKKKISQSLMGHKVSKKTRQLMSSQRRGKKWSKQDRINHKNCHNGEKHWNWKGGRSLDKSNGYIYVFNPKGRPILEHKIVVERILKRELNEIEIVHHINLNKVDNRPENLFVFENRAEHKSFHLYLKSNPKLSTFLESNLA